MNCRECGWKVLDDTNVCPVCGVEDPLGGFPDSDPPEGETWEDYIVSELQSGSSPESVANTLSERGMEFDRALERVQRSESKGTVSSTTPKHSGEDVTSRQTGSVLATLFDFSFSSFLATKLIKALYAIAVLGAVIIGIWIIAIGFSAGTSQGILALLVLAPVAFFVTLSYARIVMEVMIVLFRISENLQILVDRDASRA